MTGHFFLGYLSWTAGIERFVSQNLAPAHNRCPIAAVQKAPLYLREPGMIARRRGAAVAFGIQAGSFVAT